MDLRRVGHAIRRRAGAPSSHLEMAEPSSEPSFDDKIGSLVDQWNKEYEPPPKRLGGIGPRKLT